MVDLAERYDVILRDGSTLRLRPPGAEDRDALLAFFEALSPESLYQRFHGIPSLTPALADRFLDPEWQELGSLIGSMGEGDDERIVAHASYARLRDPETAEAAFSVADAYQRRGVGTRLLERLAALAAEAGIRRFVAEVRPENRSMLAVFTHVGFDATRELSGGTVEVQFRSRRPSGSGSASTSATTGPSSSRCGRSSSRAASPSSAPRASAGRSAASSSATSSSPTSTARPTRSTSAASRSPASRPTRRSTRSATTSTSPSSASRASACSSRPRPHCAATSARSA